MFAKRQSVTVTTAADGSASVKFPNAVNGRVFALVYTKTDFADGSTITVTSTSGQNVWTQTGVNASVIVAPRQPTSGQDGTAALYASTGTAVNDYIVLADEEVTIAIASGGDTKTGTFTLIAG